MALHGPAGSQASFLLQMGGGAVYFFSPHFSLQVFPALQLQTNRTSFGLVTSIGLHWYF